MQPLQRPIIIACAIAAVLVVGTSYYYAQKQQTPEQVVAKVFDNQPTTGEKFVAPVVSAAPNTINVNEISNISGNIPSETTPPGSVSVNEIDSNISKLWYDLRTGIDTKDKLLKQIELALQKGKTPSIVSKFPLYLTDVSSVGFQEFFSAYPNGNVKMLTLVLPSSVNAPDRLVYYFTVTVGDNIFVKMFSDLDVLPVEIATVTGENNYLMVSGSRLNDKMFTEHESLGMFAVSLRTDSIKLVETGEFTDNPKYTTITDDHGVLRFSGGSPYIYTEVEQEDRLPAVLYLATSGDEEQLVYKLMINNGKINSEYYNTIN